jgi:amino acid transporter
MLLIIVMVSVIGSTVLAFKEGKGSLKRLAFMPILSYFVVSLFMSIMFKVNNSTPFALILAPNLITAGILIAISFSVVARIRQDSMNRAMSEYGKEGRNVEKKFEL